MLFVVAGTPLIASAQDGSDELASCSAQARSLRNACGYDVQDDFWESRTICENNGDEAEREECLADAEDERTEGRQLCRDQLESRTAICDELGEAPYAPEIDPANFVADPLAIGSSVEPNTYFPLMPGTRWVYDSEEDGETITVEVTSTVKEILGVSTIVVRDVVVLTETDVASCSNDCVMTEDFTPIEPDALEQKIYARNVGVILELDGESGETVVELLEFSTP